MAREALTTIRLPGRPTVVGTGLVALDVVYNPNSNRPPRWYAGGTCGNVLTVLSYLGWESIPVSRLAPGLAGDRLLEDLRQWNVSTEFVSREEEGSTPVIIERIGRTNAGKPYHKFLWRCPTCGAHLPGYRPVPATAARQLAPVLPAAQVFFFDRVSRGALVLAETCARGGAVVVFEPSGIGDPSLFCEAWRLAHVVKYSHERLRDLAELQLMRTHGEPVLLEVETLGSEGLRYRSCLPDSRIRGWQTLDAIHIPEVKDTAGSGDWCTAGLLDKLARAGLTGLKRTSADRLPEAIRHGQALAAWNCGFEGARGGMYEMESSEFYKQVKRIASGSKSPSRTVGQHGPPAGPSLGGMCPACDDVDGENG
ncbi:MAG: carbohydrate kinase [Planctomycetes bacterium]|nr:carbohydrate kinase [Planctomycetota bacterium]